MFRPAEAAPCLVTKVLGLLKKFSKEFLISKKATGAWFLVSVLEGNVTTVKKGLCLLWGRRRLDFQSLIDGGQAEYLRVLHADKTLYHTQEDLSDETLVMWSYILPSGYEIGVLNRKIESGYSLAIICSGRVGLANLLTAQFYSLVKLNMVELDGNRLEIALSFGTTHKVNSSDLEKDIKGSYDWQMGVA